MTVSDSYFPVSWPRFRSSSVLSSRGICLFFVTQSSVNLRQPRRGLFGSGSGWPTAGSSIQSVSQYQVLSLPTDCSRKSFTVCSPRKDHTDCEGREKPSSVQAARSFSVSVSIRQFVLRLHYAAAEQKRLKVTGEKLHSLNKHSDNYH